jgi:hypothetical protein
MLIATPLPARPVWTAPQIEPNNERDLEEAFAPPPPVVVVVIVAMSLLAAVGAFVICLWYGYDGVAFTVSIDTWTAKIGCYKNQ